MTTPADTIGDPDCNLFRPFPDKIMEFQQLPLCTKEESEAFYESFRGPEARQPSFVIRDRLRSEAVLYPDVKTLLDFVFPVEGVPTMTEDYRRWPTDELWSHDPIRGYFGYYVRRQAAYVAKNSRRGFPQYLIMSHDSILPDKVHNKIGGFYPIARTRALPPHHAIIYYCGNAAIDRPFHAEINSDGTVSAILRREPLTSQRYGRRLIWG